MSTLVVLTLSFLLLLLIFIPPFSNVALGHGSVPGSCGNEYSYKLTSMTVGNGANTYDLFEDPNITFNGNNDIGYDVTFTVHTANQSVSGNNETGSIWYRTIAYGYGLGVCVYDIGPDQEKTVVVENIVPSQQYNKDSADGGVDDLQYVEWNFMFSGPEARTVTYEVSWYSASNYPADNTGTSTVTIEALDWNSTDFSNNRIRGMYVNLTKDGELIDDGFTPITFILNNGEEYQIGVADYGEYQFRNWGDAYEYDAIRTIEIQESTDLLFYAYYFNRGVDDVPSPQPTKDNKLPPAADDGDSEEEPKSNDKVEPEGDDSAAGTLISPFILRNGTTSVSEVETDNEIEEQPPQEIVDVLVVNGTLASYHFMNEMQLYILSGNWSMAMNDTAIFDFNANFTMVQASGLDRQTYSLANLTAVNDSDLLLDSDTMALTSALDFHSHANGTVTRINATITLEKLNVVKIELDNMGTPVYGVVDKVVRNVNGETLVMARQFDMI